MDISNIEIRGLPGARTESYSFTDGSAIHICESNLYEQITAVFAKEGRLYRIVYASENAGTSPGVAPELKAIFRKRPGQENRGERWYKLRDEKTESKPLFDAYYQPHAEAILAQGPADEFVLTRDGNIHLPAYVTARGVGERIRRLSVPKPESPGRTPTL